MKKLLIRYYHLVLLGAVSSLALGSAGYLIFQAGALKDSFLASPSAKKASGDEIYSSNSNSIVALGILTNTLRWNARTDGASPFVSRPYLLKDGKLIDPLLSSSPPLFPPVPNQWLMDHQLDYTDVNILERDPKQKGFTVLEEFKAGTDPNNPDECPPLYTKLTYGDADIKKSTYILEFLGEDENEGRKAYQLRPLLPLPNPAKGNRPDTSVRDVTKGDLVPGAPFLKVIDYIDKKKTINDTEYDFSELILQNTLTGENYPLTKKNVSREYQKRQIELVESVTFHYQLTGAPVVDVSVERGKEFTLTNLDKKCSETYKLVDFSKEGILLDKGGKSFTVQSSLVTPPPAQTAPSQSSTAH